MAILAAFRDAKYCVQNDGILTYGNGVLSMAQDKMQVFPNEGYRLDIFLRPLFKDLDGYLTKNGKQSTYKILGKEYLLDGSSRIDLKRQIEDLAIKLNVQVLFTESDESLWCSRQWSSYPLTQNEWEDVKGMIEKTKGIGQCFVSTRKQEGEHFFSLDCPFTEGSTQWQFEALVDQLVRTKALVSMDDRDRYYIPNWRHDDLEASGSVFWTKRAQRLLLAEALQSKGYVLGREESGWRVVELQKA